MGPESDSVPRVELQGSTVLLTGATGGIGRAIARALDERGARVLLTARRTEQLEQLAAELGGRPQRAAGGPGGRRGRGRAGGAGRARSTCSSPTPRCPPAGRSTTSRPSEIDRALDVNLRAPIQLDLGAAARHDRARPRPPRATSRRCRARSPRSGPRSTPPPSSACAASRPVCARTCTTAASG